MPALLYLMRHGETDWNREGRFQGQTDVPLNDRGRDQARDLARRVAAVPLAALYTSDLSRAAETAQIVAGAFPGLPVYPDPRLREVHAGSLAGLTLAEVRVRYPAWWSAAADDTGDVRPPGGESFGDQAARVVAALDAIAARHPGQAVGVVTHGGAIRAAICHALGLPLAHRNRLVLDNCGVTVIEWGGPVPRLRAMNCTGALPLPPG